MRVNSSFRNRKSDRGSRALAVEFHRRDDFFRVALFELHLVIADERSWRFNQHHIARDPTIIPPVRVDSRDCLQVTRVVHFDYQGIAARLELARDLILKRSKASDVLTEL